MRLFIELRTAPDGARVPAAKALQVVEAELLNAKRGWLPAEGRDEADLIDEMVIQLPREDAERFLETMSGGYRNRRLSGGLTVSYFSAGRAGHEVDVVRVRVFVAPQFEVGLAALGLDTANALLRILPEMELSELKILKDRGRLELLVGEGRAGRTRREVAKANAAASALALTGGGLALALLASAVLQDTSGATWHLLQSDGLRWFKDLIGPTSSVFVASAATLLFDYRRTRIRTASWRVGDTGAGVENGN